VVYYETNCLCLSSSAEAEVKCLRPRALVSYLPSRVKVQIGYLLYLISLMNSRGFPRIGIGQSKDLCFGSLRMERMMLRLLHLGLAVLMPVIFFLLIIAP
jgi:hypothetical protein